MKVLKKFCVCLFVLLSLNFVLICNVNANEENVPNIKSPSAILINLNTGKILYEKNVNEKMYPASLTKVMTAILTLENCDLNEVATVSYDAVMSISAGYVSANLQIGEEITVEDLLYVLMVGSANDVAIVLAEHISGSVEDFSVLMNEKAKELGATSTNFVNPSGAHEENHYSTAMDLALISKYAMQNETFRKLVSTTAYTLPATNKYDKNDRYFSTTNALLYDNDYFYKYATGVKTGFTTPAKNCLIASANKSGLELLTVVLGATQNEQGLSNRYLDTINLFEYGYDNYTLKEIIKTGGIVQTINVSNATRDTKKLDAIVANDIFALTNTNDNNIIPLPEVHFNEQLKAPIKKGDVIGFVKYTVEGTDYTADLIANSDVEKSYSFIIILSFFIASILIYLILTLAKNQKMKKWVFK